MSPGNKPYRIQEKLGAGKEGTIYRASVNGRPVVLKILTRRGQTYLPVIKEYARRRAGAVLPHWYPVEFIGTEAFYYPYEPLRPIRHYRRRLGDVMVVLRELFAATGIRYIDFGFGRNNMMETSTGELRVTDYGSGFLFSEPGWERYHDRYYTFYWRPDFFRKQMLLWYLYHARGLTFFTKGLATRFNSPWINLLTTRLLYLTYFQHGAPRDRCFGKLVVADQMFNRNWFDAIVQCLKEEPRTNLRTFRS